MTTEQLQAQVDELGLLESMFSSPGEFEVEDSESYRQAESYLQSLIPTPPNTALSCRLCFPINAHQDDSDVDNEDKAASADTPSFPYSITVSIRLPTSYPDTHPEIYASSNDLKRKSQDELNSDLQGFVGTLLPGEVCLLPIVEWIRDNAHSYFPVPCTPRRRLEPESDTDGSGGEWYFCRMWLYMHHIYSKTKRRNILSLSGELDLTGFCLPGKPGVVCVEGSVRNTREFYSVLRSWNWKSIACRQREVEESTDIESLRRIQGFGELSFDMHGHRQRQKHMDMGQFLDYLRTHNLHYMFKELFGVEGHSSIQDSDT